MRIDGDMGVCPHGENVQEMEFMVDCGMRPLDELSVATSVNAKAMHSEGMRAPCARASRPTWLFSIKAPR